MDFTPLFDIFGEAGAAAFGGLVIGALFGFFAQRSRFCLRSAVIEFWGGHIHYKVAIWFLTFATAVLTTQLLAKYGMFNPQASKQLAPVGSISGAIIGGLMFGAGMVLARGCSSRLLVLAANGNLRALLSGLVFAVIGQAALRGKLAPLRDWLAAEWTLYRPGGLDMLSMGDMPANMGVSLGLAGMAVALLAAAHSRLPFWRWFGAMGVGGCVAAAWWFTTTLASQSFEPMPVQAITFTGPSAEMLMFVAIRDEGLSFNIGLVPGVFIGSLTASLLFREFKLEGFNGAQGMRRYIVGAALMGFGGMLAGGCAVGAGVSGGSVFAVTAWLALLCMWIGAGVTDAVVDREILARARAAKGARTSEVISAV